MSSTRARRSFEGLNTGARRRDIFTSEPVRGLRPVRGARLTDLNVPKPRISMCSPSWSASMTASMKPSTTALVSVFVRPVLWAIIRTISALVKAGSPSDSSLAGGPGGLSLKHPSPYDFGSGRALPSRRYRLSGKRLRVFSITRRAEGGT